MDFLRIIYYFINFDFELDKKFKISYLRFFFWKKIVLK